MLAFSAKLMSDEFSKHRYPGQEWRRLLEAVKTTVSHSFLCLVFVVSKPVMPAELSCVICGGIVLLLQVYVRVYACVCEHCGLFHNWIKPRQMHYTAAYNTTQFGWHD